MKTDSTHKIIRTSLTLLSGLAIASSVQADQYHYKDILVGDRAAGLGGAYTAISDDVSGLYYNPAGIVYSSQPKISGSVNAFNQRTTTYKNLSKDNPNQKWKRTSAGMVANYFGATQPIGDSGTIGFSIAIPNYDLEDQTDEFHNMKGSARLSGLLNGTGIEDTSAPTASLNRHIIDFNNEDSTTLAGISYAQPITDDLSIGLTLYGYMRKRETTNWQFVQANDSSNTKTLDGTLYQKIQTEEFGLQPRLGVMWAPMERLSIGLMAQTTFMLSESSEYRQYEKYTLTDSSGTQVLSGSLAGYDLTYIPDLQEGSENDLPLELNLGAAYFPSDALLLSADFSFASETDSYEQLVNVAFGSEYYLNSTWAVRGGVYSNLANTGTDVAATNRDHVDLYGGSFAVSRYSKKSNITVGVNYFTGSGKADLFDASNHLQDVTVNGFNMYISTSASF